MENLTTYSKMWEERNYLREESITKRKPSGIVGEFVVNIVKSEKLSLGGPSKNMTERLFTKVIPMNRRDSGTTHWGNGRVILRYFRELQSKLGFCWFSEKYLKDQRINNLISPRMFLSWPRNGHKWFQLFNTTKNVPTNCKSWCYLHSASSGV